MVTYSSLTFKQNEREKQRDRQIETEGERERERERGKRQTEREERKDRTWKFVWRRRGSNLQPEGCEERESYEERKSCEIGRAHV